MLQEIVSLLRGRVRVRVRCPFPERLMNICSARGIAFSEPAMPGEEELIFTVQRRDWRRLKEACAAIDAELRAERVEGVPFLLGRLRRRRALLAGLVLCALLLALSSCFIWDFQVVGNGDVPPERILRVLAKNGVRRGAFAFSIRQHELCNHALPELPELCWLTVNTRGCRATVIVRPRVPKPEIVNESQPTNVVAARDALVTQVRALDGRAMVLPGTTVHRGQLLISGIVETGGVEKPVVGTRYLAGKGEVYGRTWYELSTRIPLTVQRKTPSGKVSRSRAILWGENRLQLNGTESGNVSGDYDKIIRRTQWSLPGGLVLPVTWVTETRQYWNTAPAERSRDEALALGRSLLEVQLRQQLNGQGEPVSVRVASAVRDGWLLVTLSAECTEQIGAVVPIRTEQPANR